PANSQSFVPLTLVSLSPLTLIATRFLEVKKACGNNKWDDGAY
ncbi:hypothetical protein Tsubulata_046846, partial [Turnera subulata]